MRRNCGDGLVEILHFHCVKRDINHIAIGIHAFVIFNLKKYAAKPAPGEDS